MTEAYTNTLHILTASPNTAYTLWKKGKKKGKARYLI